MTHPEPISGFRDLCRANGMLPEYIIRGAYQSLLSPSDVAIDCGAHKGFHTRSMAESCKDGTVVAIEALPHLADGLSERFSKRPNVIVRQCALQDDPDRQTTTFQFVSSRPGRSGISSATINTGGDNEFEFEELVVRCSTVDQELAECGVSAKQVRFVKLDLEGGEFNTLKGMRDVMSQGRAIIAYENGFHAASRGGFSEQAVVDFFRDFGYVTFTVFGEQFQIPNHDFWYAFAAPEDCWEVVADLVSALRAAIELRFLNS